MKVVKKRQQTCKSISINIATQTHTHTYSHTHTWVENSARQGWCHVIVKVSYVTPKNIVDTQTNNI